MTYYKRNNLFVNILLHCMCNIFFIVTFKFESDLSLGVQVFTAVKQGFFFFAKRFEMFVQLIG